MKNIGQEFRRIIEAVIFPRLRPYIDNFVEYKIENTKLKEKIKELEDTNSRLTESNSKQWSKIYDFEHPEEKEGQ